MNNQTTVLKITHYLLENTSQKVYTITVPMKLGRVGCNINVEDASVSSQHCLLFPDGIVLKVRDLNSTNGTFINKKKLSAGEEATLTEGDQLQFGKAMFTYSEQPISAATGKVKKKTARADVSAAPGFRLSYLRWFAYVATLVLFIALQKPKPINYSENLLFLQDFIGTQNEMFAQMVKAAIFVLVTCGAHAFVCHSWINNRNFPRSGSLLRFGAYFFAFLFMGIGITLTASQQTEAHFDVETIVDLRPKLLRQVEQGEIKKAEVKRYLRAVNDLLQNHPDNLQSGTLKMLSDRDQSMFRKIPQDQWK